MKCFAGDKNAVTMGELVLDPSVDYLIVSFLSVLIIIIVHHCSVKSLMRAHISKSFATGEWQWYDASTMLGSTMTFVILSHHANIGGLTHHSGHGRHPLRGCGTISTGVSKCLFRERIDSLKSRLGNDYPRTSKNDAEKRGRGILNITYGSSFFSSALVSSSLPSSALAWAN